MTLFATELVEAQKTWVYLRVKWELIWDHELQEHAGGPSIQPHDFQSAFKGPLNRYTSLLLIHHSDLCVHWKAG